MQVKQRGRGSMKMSEEERRGARCVREWIFAILIGESLDMMNRIYRRGEPYKSCLLSLSRVFYFI